MSLNLCTDVIVGYQQELNEPQSRKVYIMTFDNVIMTNISGKDKIQQLIIMQGIYYAT